jgi:1-acyl-sn-glycerol-3-phosphate acyltransferase
VTAAEITPAYRAVIGISGVFLKLSHIRVSGTEHIPLTGPVLIVANHDSNWDPVAIGYAGRERRLIRALAKASLWKQPVAAKILDGMRQIPLERGAGAAAMRVAEQALRDGACIGVFPEGTRSLGRQLSARSGVGWLAAAVPEATIVCCRAHGTTDRVWLPGAARVRVEFFPPAGGQLQPGETAEALSARLLAEIREGVPPTAPAKLRRATE